jgi:hypothetical protein
MQAWAHQLDSSLDAPVDSESVELPLYFDILAFVIRHLRLDPAVRSEHSPSFLGQLQQVNHSMLEAEITARHAIASFALSQRD